MPPRAMRVGNFPVRGRQTGELVDRVRPLDQRGELGSCFLRTFDDSSRLLFSWLVEQNNLRVLTLAAKVAERPNTCEFSRPFALPFDISDVDPD